MSVASDLAYLLISSSVDPDTTRRVDLVASTSNARRSNIACCSISIGWMNVEKEH